MNLTFLLRFVVVMIRSYSFSHLFSSHFTVLFNYFFCAMDTTRRVLNTWYKLQVDDYMAARLEPSDFRSNTWWIRPQDHNALLVSVMLMFVGVMNFHQVQKIRFVVVKNFRSNSNQFLIILIWSSELDSAKRAQKTFRIHNSGCGSFMKHSSLVPLRCRIKQKYGKRGHCVKI